MDLQDKRQELAELYLRTAQLESEIAAEGDQQWPPRGFYGAYYATTGFLLGGIAAIVSLAVNALLAPLAGKSPLELIKVYLTFPMGQPALALDPSGNGWLILSLGVCLYLGTGMLLGVPLYWGMSRLCGPFAPLSRRIAVGVVVALALWLVAFYGVLVWFQPLLLGGRWITNPAILPPWVAAGTHVVFGLTIALLYPLGQFTPYRPPTERPSTAFPGD